MDRREEGRDLIRGKEERRALDRREEGRREKHWIGGKKERRDLIGGKEEERIE